MSINERGEFIRTSEGRPEQEKDPLAQLSEWKESFSAQSVAPSDKPEGLLYWKGERLNHYRELFEQMKEYALALGITEFSDPRTQEVINLESFFDNIKRSIEYSEQVTKTEETQENKTDKKKRLIDRLNNK